MKPPKIFDDFCDQYCIVIFRKQFYNYMVKNGVLESTHYLKSFLQKISRKYEYDPIYNPIVWPKLIARLTGSLSEYFEARTEIIRIGNLISYYEKMSYSLVVKNRFTSLKNSSMKLIEEKTKFVEELFPYKCSFCGKGFSNLPDCNECSSCGAPGITER